MDKALRTSLTIGATLAGIALILSLRKKDKTVADKNIIIGDSHAVGISRLLKNVEKSKCAVGGWMVSNLISCLNNEPTRNDVGKVFISIGTNGLYSSSDKVEQLIDLIRQKYPNANLYVYGGSYGWSGSLSKSDVEARRNRYYQRFSSKSVKLLTSSLGYFKTDAQAHSISSPQAKSIANEINEITDGT
jgi:hypothetical protein